IKKLLIRCDFTLGEPVEKFEKLFSKRVNSKFSVGVGSGTDAIFLALKLIGVKEGDEVITTPFTYIATVGAIATAGATPVFVDIKDDCNIDESLIEKKITKKTKAIVPVHWTGRMCNMKVLKRISKKHNIKIIQDACHAIDSKLDNRSPAFYGDFACYSMHPLKNLNVWGDGGVISFNDKTYYEKLRLMRNHGLKSREDCRFFAYNSRLDSIQAIVGNYLLENKLTKITNSRIKNSKYLDLKLENIKEIILTKRDRKIKEVFHLYQIRVKERNKLNDFLRKNGIDSKVHYSKPIHLHKASENLKYKKGSFPIAEKIASEILSLPVHEFISKKDLDFMVSKIIEFYN
ncbi:DegT/DnrJ/EryC1/StrS family aminotransferase, partial [Candidatus Pelagibacter sp.]|nr:DegT/DnrJ/EryC1/StrS family aminotransferase [Candidatus Pelagibacter sp.]